MASNTYNPPFESIISVPQSHGPSPLPDPLNNDCPALETWVEAMENKANYLPFSWLVERDQGTESATTETLNICRKAVTHLRRPISIQWAAYLAPQKPDDVGGEYIRMISWLYICFNKFTGFLVSILVLFSISSSVMQVS
jgi:hypothetical protein